MDEFYFVQIYSANKNRRKEFVDVILHSSVIFLQILYKCMDLLNILWYVGENNISKLYINNA